MMLDSVVGLRLGALALSRGGLDDIFSFPGSGFEGVIKLRKPFIMSLGIFW